MTLTDSTFLTGLGTGQERVTHLNDPSSFSAFPKTTEAIKGTSLSDFTDKYKYANLITRISDNITNRDASIKVFSQAYSISGNDIKPTPATLKISIDGLTGLDNKAAQKLDSGANKLGKTVDTIKSNFTSAITNNPSIMDKLKLNRPDVVNMSSAGFLDQKKIQDAAHIFKITAYDTPTRLTLSAIDNLGKSIDEQIKNSLIVQLSGLKGTDLLCTALCFLMSLLPCKTTNGIVDAIDQIQDLQRNVNSGLQQATAAEREALSQINFGFSQGATGLANISDVKKSVQQVLKRPKKSGNNVQDAVALVKSSVGTLAVVTQLLNLLVSVIRLAYSDPWGVLGWVLNGVFDLLENVLQALQSMAIQIADSIMNKVIAPIEKYLNNNAFPALCGISAQLLFRKLLQMIYDFKKKILGFISDLFAFQKSIRRKFNLFNDNLLITLELSAFIKIFELLINNFLDIAIACGIQRRPCPDQVDNSTPNLSQNYSGAFKDDAPITNINNNSSDIPRPKTLNDMAVKLQPMIDSIFPGANSSVSPGMISNQLNNLPPLITAMLDNIPLGPNFTIYPDKNSATIIYQRAGFCS